MNDRSRFKTGISQNRGRANYKLHLANILPMKVGEETVKPNTCRGKVPGDTGGYKVHVLGTNKTGS